MKNTENLLNNKLNDAQSLEGVDTNSLWDAIETEMDAPKGINKSKWLFLALLLITFSGGLTWYSTQGGNDTTMRTNLVAEEQNDNLKKKVNSIDKNIVEINENNKEEVKSIIPTNNLDINTNEKVSNKEKTNTVKRNIEVSNKGSETIIYNSKTNSIDTESIGKPSYGVALTETKQLVNPNTENVRNDKVVLNTNDLTQALQDINRIKKVGENVKLLAIKYSSLKETPYLMPSFDFNKIDVEIDLDEDKNNRWFITLNSGVNTFKSIYKDNKALKGANNINLGQTQSLSVGYQLNDKYFITTGLQYNHINEVFRHESSTISEKLYLGELQNVETTRTVVHYNKYKVLTIPLSVGVTKSLNNFKIGSEIGIAYNYVLSQKGKNYDSELSIVEYDSKSSDLTPLKKSYLGFHINPYIEYKLNKNIDFRLAAGASYQNLGKSPLYGINQQGLLFNLSAGIKYKF